MDQATIRERLNAALEALAVTDSDLLRLDVGERAIAGRIAVYLTALFPSNRVDVEYNRHGGEPKRLQVPDECANRRNLEGKALVVPDIVVHSRGDDDNNILVLEVKKASGSEERMQCDRVRLEAFKRQFGYRFAAAVIVTTGAGAVQKPTVHWV